jgi:hypothetical protein
VTRLLVLLGGLLMAILVTELRSGPIESRRLFVPDHMAPKPVVHHAAAAASTKAWADIILARPLFEPDRRPRHSPSFAVAEQDMPRLAGIIESSEETLAIFQPNRDAKSVIARVGEAVGGWQITTITTDEVNLRQANKTISLRPEFDSAQRIPAPVKVAATPSRWQVAAPRGLLRARWSNPQLQP